MRICIVSYIINPMSGARAPIELAFALSKKHQITFIAYDINFHQETLKNLQDKGIKVFIVKKSKNKFAIYEDFSNFYQLIKISKPNAVLTHSTLIPLLAAKLAHLPIIATYYGTQFNPFSDYSYPTFVTHFLNFLADIVIYLKTLIMIWLPTKVVSISIYCSKEAKLLYFRSSDTIYLGNISNFLKVKRKNNPQKNKIQVLSISRITPYKQFDRIIKKFNKIDSQKVKLTIIGSAPQNEHLKYLKKIAGNNTKFIINAEDRVVKKYLSSSDIYVTADKNLFFGMPILEAASVGIPAIAYNYKAAKEIIADGTTGYIARNDKEFLYFLKLLIDTKRLRNRMGIEAKRRANKKFRWNITAKHYIKIIRQVI